MWTGGNCNQKKTRKILCALNWLSQQWIWIWMVVISLSLANYFSKHSPMLCNLHVSLLKIPTALTTSELATYHSLESYPNTKVVTHGRNVNKLAVLCCPRLTCDWFKEIKKSIFPSKQNDNGCWQSFQEPWDSSVKMTFELMCSTDFQDEDGTLMIVNRTWHSSLVPFAKLQRLQRHPATPRFPELVNPSSFYIMNCSAVFCHLTCWLCGSYFMFHLYITQPFPPSTQHYGFFTAHLAIRAIEKKPGKQNQNKQKCRMMYNLEENAALSLQNYSKNRPQSQGELQMAKILKL